ncbi:MAG: hypothetical protein HUJ25_03080 [Crocinitomicaceae bacterium]|nr:hypothetical protein [Crocinitomicaceae bacterium]
MEDLTLKWRLFISLTFLLMSCEEEKGPLPAKTHEGLNTIGYYVEFPLNYQSNSNNGYIAKTWRDHGDSCYVTNNELIIIDSDPNNLAGFYGSLENHDLKMTFQLDPVSENVDFSDVEYYNPLNPSSYYFQDGDSSYYCDVTYHNTSKKIISGIFAFTLTQVDSVVFNDTLHLDTTGLSVKVTQGRFDLKYH